MIPLNSAPRRSHVRLTQARLTDIRLRLCPTVLAALLTAGAGAQAAGVQAAGAQGKALSTPSGQPPRPKSALPAAPTALPASPFAYVHGAQPRPTARPNERVVFTVEGPAKRQTFTLRQLQALPTVRYTTCQPQLKREAVYEGVPLRDLAALGGFAGRDVRISASNGFVTTIRAHDYLHEPIMLAHHADGKPISALTKGPLTVVLPRGPQRFLTPAYGAAWVWFAVRLAPVP